MIHLDTHVVVWIHGGEPEKLSRGARELIEAEDIYVSPMVAFELQILYELGRVTEPGFLVLDDLRSSIRLQVAGDGFELLGRMAMSARFAFTRDPFDRLIAAHASMAGVQLLTKDRKLRQHLDFAVWP